MSRCDKYITSNCYRMHGQYDVKFIPTNSAELCGKFPIYLKSDFTCVRRTPLAKRTSQAETYFSQKL
jgi:hypothetical protein